MSWESPEPILCYFGTKIGLTWDLMWHQVGAKIVVRSMSKSCSQNQAKLIAKRHVKLNLLTVSAASAISHVTSILFQSSDASFFEHFVNTFLTGILGYKHKPGRPKYQLKRNSRVGPSGHI